ncbi:MAG: tautomerase family protein [Xanthobacteraceae bacterium]
MPFVRIDLARGKPVEYRKAIGEIVYQAMRDIIDVPENDKFQIITEHESGELNLTENYLGNHYSGDVILIQITMSFGRSVEKKQAFYKRRRRDQSRRGREGKLVFWRRNSAVRDVSHPADAARYSHPDYESDEPRDQPVSDSLSGAQRRARSLRAACAYAARRQFHRRLSAGLVRTGQSR